MSCIRTTLFLKGRNVFFEKYLCKYHPRFSISWWITSAAVHPKTHSFSSEATKPKTTDAETSHPVDKPNAKKKSGVTPAGKFDDTDDDNTRHPHAEKEPLKPWPNNRNPHTGEIGGPKGPEPTRFGDWERKGRVSDF